jgi:hypothetical protein
MPSKNVDIVFVIDASESMGPCFKEVCRNIGTLFESLRKTSFNVKIGLLAHCMPNHTTYRILGLSSLKSVDAVDALYDMSYRNMARELLFSSDAEDFCRLLNQITPMGDEDSLCALDTACDFPFGPLQNTQRVIILLSDETFETGLPGAPSLQKIPQIIEKLHARNITLFAVLPPSRSTSELSTANRADIEITDNIYDGLKDFDFRGFFKQLGKTISRNITLLTEEPPYQRALFDQDQWGVSQNTTVIRDKGCRQ